MMRSSLLCCALILMCATGGMAARHLHGSNASSTPVAANAGLNAPIYNSWDLINVNTSPQVGPVVGTLGNSSVLLGSMPASGSTLGTITIAPCSTFFIHSHPRSTELSQVTAGPLTVGYLFENNTYTEYEVQTNEFFVAPAGETLIT